MPGISTQVADALDRGWHYATLLFGETQIRTGHVLVAALKSLELRRALINCLAGIRQDPGRRTGRSPISASGRTSEEANLRPMDGSGVAAAETPAGEAALGPKGTTALDRFSQDLTAKAKGGDMDPILGRDDEIRQIVDVLMRRRQNNPILTGEAGVGKTAVVEGFAQRIAAGDVPPPLRDVRVCVLDVGLMQAGASMKGEFEQRLRSVIDEAQSSPTPVILFIDEAHTLIGAGGQAGTGDAANLLKPALARGTAAHHRGDHVVGVSPVFREGPGAGPALPADPHRRARRRHGGRDAARPGRRRWRSITRCASPTRRSSRR